MNLLGELRMELSAVCEREVELKLAADGAQAQVLRLRDRATACSSSLARS